MPAQRSTASEGHRTNDFCNVWIKYPPRGGAEHSGAQRHACKSHVAGDTENIPQMADLADVDVAFLPMNLPYTMTPQMAADAARTLEPKIIYPYHFGKTDTSKLVVT